MVGPVRRDDIPISAVDFHVSDLVPSLLMNDDIFQAAEDVAQLPGSGCDDAEQALKKAKPAVLSLSDGFALGLVQCGDSCLCCR